MRSMFDEWIFHSHWLQRDNYPTDKGKINATAGRSRLKL